VAKFYIFSLNFGVMDKGIKRPCYFIKGKKVTNFTLVAKSRALAF